MSKFKTDIGPKIVESKSNTVELPVSNKLYKDYYDISSGEILPLEFITKRVVRRFFDIDKTSVLAMLDLFWIKTNWKEYGRTETFSSYLQEIGLSKTHAYGILNAVKLLNEYFQYKESNKELTDFMLEITSSIETVGIKKLIIISAVKDSQTQFEYLDRLLLGEEIPASYLLKKPEKKEKKKSKIKLDGLDLKLGKDVVLTFTTEDKKLIKAISNTVDKFYSK